MVCAWSIKRVQLQASASHGWTLLFTHTTPCSTIPQTLWLAQVLWELLGWPETRTQPGKHPFSKSSTFVLMSSISLSNYILGSNHLMWWWSLIKNERKENLHVYYFKIKKFCLQGNWHVKYFHLASSQYKLNDIGIVLSNSV